ncbi:MAG TPA: hypothetical protein VFS67_32965 [Polyangiaceae bacterium]|nr:hypothetical protein [Polyangiaceae bacterium]
MRTSSAAFGATLLLSALGCGEVYTPGGEPVIPSAAAGAGSSVQQPTGAPSTPPASQNEPDAAALNPPSNGGSGAETDPDLLPPIEYCDAPAKLLTPKCGGGSCHGNPGAVMGDFAIDAQHAVKFVDKFSTRHAECGRIIDSRDYSKSFMLIKTRGDLLSNLSPEQAASVDDAHCGGRMPVGSIVITEDQIDCLASWLQQFQVQR